ncbi:MULTISPECIES: TRAP transporter substrate-binding protein [Comamonas]|uniref:TRAP transporter substrate-binding protein DctP n=1 Tax=Comamonas avium TaxID=2762231 RepID=A0ABR8SAR3_9BURK|nr:MULTISPECIES: TRAP transporter substrate-binding protein DctP [Comamonas]MBD7960484.1 TRAP transporter substrate-binding protein DctP [Comamonas avium]MBD9401750.1 TRAP transporter substrate-binding protein DctP [Comamonas sp. CMM02]
MDRRSMLKNAGIAGVLAAAAAPAVHAQPALRWRIASSFPKSLDTIYGSADVFANAVKSMTGGKFDVSVHQAGELMPAFNVVDGVQSGTVEMAHTAPYYFFGKNEVFAIGGAIPFGMNSRQLTAWMVDGNGTKLMTEFYAKYNIVPMLGGNTGAQMGGWFRKEVKTTEDIKGLKFRVGGFAGKVLEKMGAVPQNIPAGEIYQSLEKGTIDAAEWIGPYDDLKLGLNKVAPFYYYPGWWEGSLNLSFYINDKAFNSLSNEYKAIVKAAAHEAHVTCQGRYDARNPAALKQLVAAGAKVLPFPQQVMDASFKASMEVYAGLDKSNPDWKKVYTDYRNFQRDQVLWFRFAEGRFDNFMSTQKL